MEASRIPASPALPVPKSKPFDLDEVLSQTTFFPPSFEIIPRLLLLLDDPDVNSEALAEIIRVDAGLTADVLRVCNSAALGGSRQTDSLVDAVIRLGLREIYFVVMKIVSSPIFSSPQLVGCSSINLWRHSLATAVAAQLIATRSSQQPPELVFTSAILHDIGKVLLAQARGAEYLQLLESCGEGNHDAFTEETALYQTNHATIGARLLEKWKFPEKIITAVGHHHDAELCGTPEGALSATVYLGNILAYRIGQGHGFPIYAVHPESAVLQTIGISPDELDAYETETGVAFQRELNRFR